MAATPNFRSQERMKKFDCVIETCDGSLFCHQEVLRRWSPVLRAFFKRNKIRNSQEIPKFEIRKCKSADFVLLLQMIYPPNKEINEKSVVTVTGLAAELQMDEVLLRAESFLLSQPINLKSVIFAQNYQLEQLLQAGIDKLSDLQLPELEGQRQWQQVDDAVKCRMAKCRLEKLELKVATADGERRKLHEKQIYLLEIFKNLQSAWTFEGENAKLGRDSAWQEVQRALSVVRGDQ